MENNNLGKILRQHRLMIPLTLEQLSDKSGVSPSHLGRVERRERYPSAFTLRKISEPLGIGEVELLSLANYLSPDNDGGSYLTKIDPYVASVLSRESVKTQRNVIFLLAALKGMAKEVSDARS